MWTRLILIAFVAASAVQAWTPSTEYSYRVQSRTLSALHQVGDQYSGMLMRATLKLYAPSQDKLYAKLSASEYADVHQSLPGGWGSPINEQSLQWQKLDMTSKTFTLQLRNGVIDHIRIQPDVPEWEINMIKGIVSQLQVDSRAENVINSRYNQLANEDSEQAVYKTMEDSVTGRCEVLYDISPLPEYVLQSHPQLVPKPSQNSEETHALDIVKSTNYSNCEQRPVFHHGFGGENDWAPASSNMGQFLARSSVSRVVVTGRPENNLIQSSVTTNKVVLSPAVYNKQKGMVVSRMNLTLLAVHSSESQHGWEDVQQAVLKIKDLVYQLIHPNTLPNQHQQYNNEREDYNEQGQIQYDSEERMQGAAAHRFRRSLKPAQQEQRKHRNNQESLERSESDEDASIDQDAFYQLAQHNSNMNDAPQIPFLPFFTGYNGMPIQGKFDAVQKIVNIAREVAMELQNPKEVPQKNTLAKFTILSRLVQTLSAEQLHQVTEQLYSSGDSSNEAKAWKVYRDAVNQAGTAPALVTIKNWIDSKKVQGEEAAEMVAQIPHVALIPNKQYVNLFFQIATSESVKSQRHLNTTAILSFTELVRKAQVDGRYAHNSYPTHIFGRMNPTQAPAVTREYIPYLAHQLRQAVREGDSVRIQTYVRALGNVAHPKILSVLEPYLEGERHVSDFQRLHMVMSLNKIRKVQPALARAIFYRLYKNKAEIPEIRSAAVYLLMKANPQANMLQRLAESVNYEHSKQVRSAVKSALESAASSQYWQLAENAQAAINLLNNTVYGPEYSNIKVASGKVPEMNIAYLADLSTIGSEDFIAPKATFAHFRQILSGLKLESQSAGYMASSTKDLMNLIIAQFGKSFSHPENMENQREYAQQVEGNLLFRSQLGERFFAFDNHTIEHIPEYLQHIVQRMAQGHNFGLQKMYNRQAFTLAFPTASGLPFVYQLTKPTVISAQGKAQARIQPNISQGLKSGHASAEVQLLYSTKSEAVFGFVAPFNGKIYTAGTEHDAQVALPIRAELEINTPLEGSEINQTNMRLKLQPLNPENVQVAIFRANPYTAQQKIAELRTTQMRTIQAHRPRHMNIVVGRETTGMAFRIQGNLAAENFDYAGMLRHLQKLDIVSAIASATEERNINSYETTITFDHSESHAKSVSFTAKYGSLNKNTQSGPNAYQNERTKTNAEDNIFDDNLAIPSNSAPASNERLQQFLHRVAETMQVSRASAIDLSAQFNGEREAVYIATVSGAASPMHDRYAALVYLRHACANGQKNSMAMFPSVHIPYAPLANYQQAINNKPTAQVDTKITFGNDLENSPSQLHIKTNMERSAEREQYVREQPISAFCQQQAEQGNNFLPACQNATIAAGHMDRYNVHVQYSRVPESIWNATYKVYSLAREFGWEYHSEDLFVRNQPGQFNLQVRFAPNLRAANVSINVPRMNAHFNNIRLHGGVSAALVAHPNYMPSELVSRYVFGKNYNPTCTIDNSAVSTFDNQTFALPQGQQWYLVAQYVPKQYQHTKYSPANQVPYFKVQTRQGSSNQKEVKIFFGAKDIVQIIPRGAEEHPEIKVNNQLYKIDSARPTEVESQVDNRALVRFYGLPSGTMRLVAPRYELEIVYDTNTFVLKVGNQYRNDLRGLCGDFDGETETDFTTPRECIARNSELFIKSMTVTSEGNLKHRELSSQPRDCIYKKSIRTNLVNNVKAGHEQGSTMSQGSLTCMNLHHAVVEHEGQVCFSVRRLPKCSRECQPGNYVQKNIEFHCRAESTAVSNWVALALKGSKLDVASKGANMTLKMTIPQSCEA